MDSLKNIKVTGSAADEYTSSGGKRKSRKQKAGGSTSPGTLLQLASTRVPGLEDPKPLVEPSIGAPVSGGGAGVAGVAGAGVAGVAGAGGAGVAAAEAPAPPAKVVLTKKRKSKVILAPPKKGGATAPLVSGSARQKTRKVKRIHISLPGLSKKINRANKIKGDTKTMDIAEVKKALLKVGLVKETTKAPEGILRQMYSDYMTLKNKAL
jgi:hypothetical protein